jgi:hypothetical protein
VGANEMNYYQALRPETPFNSQQMADLNVQILARDVYVIVSKFVSIE